MSRGKYFLRKPRVPGKIIDHDQFRPMVIDGRDSAQNPCEIWLVFELLWLNLNSQSHRNWRWMKDIFKGNGAVECKHRFRMFRYYSITTIPFTEQQISTDYPIIIYKLSDNRGSDNIRLTWQCVVELASSSSPLSRILALFLHLARRFWNQTLNFKR